MGLGAPRTAATRVSARAASLRSKTGPSSRQQRHHASSAPHFARRSIARTVSFAGGRATGGGGGGSSSPVWRGSVAIALLAVAVSPFAGLLVFGGDLVCSCHPSTPPLATGRSAELSSPAQDSTWSRVASSMSGVQAGHTIPPPPPSSSAKRASARSAVTRTANPAR